MTTREKDLAGWVKKARKSAGISQKALAVSLGVSQPAVAHWEAGYRRVPAQMLFKIAKLCNVSLEDM